MPGLFQHRLRPLKDIIAGWEAIEFDVPRYLGGWFWLTDGWYWLSTPQGDVPTTHPDFNTKYSFTGPEAAHLDYQVARFWLDLQEVLADALNPLPDDLARLVESGAWHRWYQAISEWWNKLDDEDPRCTDMHREWLSDAQGWWSLLHLDMGYLVAPPRLRFWRVGDRVTIEWDTRERYVDGVLCWTEQHGRLTLGLSAFEAEVQAFRARLDLDMRSRLDKVATLGVLDGGQLENLARQHEETLQMWERNSESDWTAVRTAIRAMEDLSGMRLEEIAF